MPGGGPETSSETSGTAGGHCLKGVPRARGGEAGKGPTPADTHEGVASAPSGPQTKLIITEFRVFLFSSCHAVIDRQKYSKLGIISIFECVYLSDFEIVY